MKSTSPRALPPTTPSETPRLDELHERLRELKNLIQRGRQEYEARREQQLEQLAKVHRHIQSVEQNLQVEGARFHDLMEHLNRNVADIATEISRIQTALTNRDSGSNSDPDVAPSLIHRLAQFVNEQGKLPTTFSDLIELGVPATTVLTLQRLVKQGHREDDVVIAWLTEQTDRTEADAVDERLRTRLARAAQQGLRKLVRALRP
jgi:exonuclease VII large subunit